MMVSREVFAYVFKTLKLPFDDAIQQGLSIEQKNVLNNVAINDIAKYK